MDYFRDLSLLYYTIDCFDILSGTSLYSDFGKIKIILISCVLIPFPNIIWPVRKNTLENQILDKILNLFPFLSVESQGDLCFSETLYKFAYQIASKNEPFLSIR